jgi:hypothetical protein
MFTPRHTVAAVVGLMLTLAALMSGAPSALAQLPPDPAGQGEVIAPATQGPSVISYGSPIWVFVVVAVTTAALTGIIMLVSLKLRRSAHSAPALA